MTRRTRAFTIQPVVLALLLMLGLACEPAPETTSTAESPQVEAEEQQDGDGVPPILFPGQPIKVGPKSGGPDSYVLDWEEQTSGGAWVPMPTNGTIALRGDMIWRAGEIKATDAVDAPITEPILALRVKLNFELVSGEAAVVVEIDVDHGYLDWNIPKVARNLCCGTEPNCKGVPAWLKSEVALDTAGKPDFQVKTASGWQQASHFFFTPTLDTDVCWP